MSYVLLQAVQTQGRCGFERIVDSAVGRSISAGMDQPSRAVAKWWVGDTGALETAREGRPVSLAGGDLNAQGGEGAVWGVQVPGDLPDVARRGTVSCMA
jgi:hypothetical protein